MTVTFSVTVYDAVTEEQMPLGVTPTEDDARHVAELQCEKLVEKLHERGLAASRYEVDGWRYLVLASRSENADEEDTMFVVEVDEIDEVDEDDVLEE